MTLLLIQLICGYVVKVPRQFRSIELARRLGNWSRLEVRALIRSLWAKNEMSKTAIWQGGRPSSSTTEINTARIETIQNDRWVTLSKISLELGLSYGSVQHIVSDVLRCSKTVL
ncbi:hypothetical protein TNCV_2754471 [Trichonephila clavipes]|nr:hypothetical protein TNCV_2754471 [Trichonephila clavipes]